MNCGTCSSCEAKPTLAPDTISEIIADIQKLFQKEGSAINYVSDHETYLTLLANAPFYVSAVHTRDGEDTWWAAAVDKDAYDEWEKDVEHQHHPCEQHEHYLCMEVPL
jgi:hypothetical protein